MRVVGPTFSDRLRAKQEVQQMDDIQPREADTSEERREADLRRVYKKGSIVFGDRTQAIDCLVRSISESGVNLAVENSVSVPDEFELLISEERRSAPVKVVRRSNDEIAVSLVGPWKLSLTKRSRIIVASAGPIRL